MWRGWIGLPLHARMYIGGRPWLIQLILTAVHWQRVQHWFPLSSFKVRCAMTAFHSMKFPFWGPTHVGSLSAKVQWRKTKPPTARDGDCKAKIKEWEEREEPARTSVERDGMLKCRAHPSPGHQDMHAWTRAAECGHTQPTLAALQTPVGCGSLFACVWT